jgi:hypothetical protein
VVRCRPILAVVGEGEAAIKDAPFHARVAGAVLDLLAAIVDFMGAPPGAHDLLSSWLLSIEQVIPHAWRWQAGLACQGPGRFLALFVASE